MTERATCPVCSRTNAKPEIILCEECLEDYRKHHVLPVPVDVISWAAKRAWKFAGAEVDIIRATAKAHIPGDPGRSGFRVRGRR